MQGLWKENFCSSMRVIVQWRIPSFEQADNLFSPFFNKFRRTLDTTYLFASPCCDSRLIFVHFRRNKSDPGHRFNFDPLLNVERDQDCKETRCGERVKSIWVGSIMSWRFCTTLDRRLQLLYFPYEKRLLHYKIHQISHELPIA